MTSRLRDVTASRRGRAAVLTVLTAGASGAFVLMALPASAHVANIAGSSVCQSDGSQLVTWSVTNTLHQPAVIQSVSSTPDPTTGISGTLPGVPVTPSASATAHAASSIALVGTETVPAGSSATSATIDISVRWQDGFRSGFTGSVMLTGCPSTAPSSTVPTTAPATVPPTTAPAVGAAVPSTSPAPSPSFAKGSAAAASVAAPVATTAAPVTVPTGPQTLAFTGTGRRVPGLISIGLLMLVAGAWFMVTGHRIRWSPVRR